MSCGDCKHVRTVLHAPFVPETVKVTFHWRPPFIRREVITHDRIRMDWCHRYPKSVLAKHKCGEYEPMEANL